MSQYPFLILFIFTLTSRSLIAISSSHWLIVWISLEINIISFIPIISSSSWLQESEGAIKYLLFQALGSSLILLGSLFPTFNILILFGLLTKLGAAPFHFWFPSIIKRIPWPTSALLLTWQKIAPMIILISSFSRRRVLFIFGALRALVGGLGGLTQTHLRPLLAYSSIGHIGWMVATTPVSPLISTITLIFYIIISLPVVWCAFLTNTQTLIKKRTVYIIFFIILPCILSLSGLPPFIGFFPKLFALFSFTNPIVPLCLILGSLLNLGYYLNFFFFYYISSTPTSIINTTPAPFILFILSWLACSPLIGTAFLYFIPFI